MEDIVTKSCDIVSWHVRFLKKEIEMSQDKKIKLDMRDISKLICSDTIIDSKYSEEICQNLKDIFSNKGISTTIEEYENGEKFLTLRKEEDGPIIDKSKEVKTAEVKTAEVETVIYSENEKKNFNDILKNNKLYDEETKYLLCPECHRYSVIYSTSSYKEYDKRWWCNHCLDVIIYQDYDLDISDKDKYHIYKLWGAEALSIFTNKSMKKTIGFVASYFKNCCVTKKDKCLYFDFFKEKDKNYNVEDNNVEVEGDVNNERSKMGIVCRGARSE